jgi:hypothetical protein
MDDNDVLDQQLPLAQELPVESVEVTNNVILNPDGTTTLVGSTREVAVVLPDGGHRFEKTHVLTGTINGRVVDHAKGEIACNCPNCLRGPYSADFMVTCSSCGRTVCRTCTVIEATGSLCATCHRAFKRQAFWNKLFNIA